MQDTNISRKHFLQGVAGVTASMLLYGCGSSDGGDAAESGEIESTDAEDASTETNETEEKNQESETIYAIGDTVETDALRFTLNDAALAIALYNSFNTSQKGADMDFGKPKEYNAEDDTGNHYVAALNHTLVYYDFTATNLNRGRIWVETGTPDTLTNPEEVGFVTINGENYDFGSYDDETEMEYTLKYTPDGHFSMGESEIGVDVSLDPEVPTTIRVCLDVPVEVENLDEEFRITFLLPDSNGERTPFTFQC
jgi:hypothetical protein